MTPAVEAWSPNQWATREVLLSKVVRWERDGEAEVWPRTSPAFLHLSLGRSDTQCQVQLPPPSERRLIVSESLQRTGIQGNSAGKEAQSIISHVITSEHNCIIISSCNIPLEEKFS